MKRYHASVTVTLRKGILDVQGKTVEHALHGIGFSAVSDVRIGRHVDLTVLADSQDHARELVHGACNRLIANPIMEDFHIEIREHEHAEVAA